MPGSCRIGCETRETRELPREIRIESEVREAERQESGEIRDRDARNQSGVETQGTSPEWRRKEPVRSGDARNQEGGDARNQEGGDARNQESTAQGTESKEAQGTRKERRRKEPGRRRRKEPGEETRVVSRQVRAGRKKLVWSADRSGRTKLVKVLGKVRLVGVVKRGHVWEVAYECFLAD